MRFLSARDFWQPLLLVTLVAAVWGAMLGRGAREHVALLRAEAGLRADLMSLRAQNARLRAERRELSSDLVAIERAAREDMVLTVPGEELAGERPATCAADAQPCLPRLSWGESMLLRRDLATAVPAVVFAVSALLLLLWNAAAHCVRRAGRDGHVST